VLSHIRERRANVLRTEVGPVEPLHQLGADSTRAARKVPLSRPPASRPRRRTWPPDGAPDLDDETRGRIPFKAMKAHLQTGVLAAPRHA
jgi:hypothetical protein